MISTKFGTLIRQQWAGLLALFLVLTSGTAYALSGSNTVFSDDIVDGEVKPADLATDSVTSGKIRAGQVLVSDLAANAVTSGKVAPESLTAADVANNTLGGDDIDESRLGEVMSAALGGRGDASGMQHRFVACDPNTTAFESCAATEIVLPAPSRVLLIGRVAGFGSGDVPESEFVSGDCLLATSHGFVPDSTVSIETLTQRFEDDVLVAITDVLPAGFSAFGVECSDKTADGSMMYFDVAIAAVALSAIEG